MPLSKPLRTTIQRLKKKYAALSKGKESLMKMIDEIELYESVYNSNAIENSTLTLKETEKILLEMEVSRQVSLREVFEAKNLARVMEYIKKKASEKELTPDLVLLLHKMLIMNINDQIAGQFRQKGEYVRVGLHIAPAPEHVPLMIDQLFAEDQSDLEGFITDKIAKFHLRFEHLHPFVDGNGRIGRVLINYQLLRQGLPVVIIRNKEKSQYYKALREFDDHKSKKSMEKIIALALIESLHKRLAYLGGCFILDLADYAKTSDKSPQALLNAAKRQNIPAFRERGVWRIGIESDVLK